MSDAGDDDQAASLREIASQSENIWSWPGFEETMHPLGYNLIDVYKAFKKGEIKVYDLERGSNSVYSFCVAYLFQGYKEACHIRGWVDFSTREIDLTDIFESTDMCL